jgi:Flp pilus assembly protein TadD
MKNKVLGGLVCALSITACSKNNESKPSSPPPAIVSRSAAPAPVEQAPVPEPIDPLALVHEDRGPRAHVERANELKIQGDFDGAMTEARRALHDDAGDEEALRLVAKLGRYTREFPLALGALDRLGELRTDADPLVQKGRILLRTGDFAEAVATGEAAAEREPENPEAYQVIGRAELSQRHLQRAIEAFQKAVELAPDHGHALNNLGYSYLLANENQKAAEVLELAAELLPDTAYIQNNLGVALERVGRVDEAHLAFVRSVGLSPKYLKAQLNAKRIKSVAVLDLSSEDLEMQEPDAHDEADEAPALIDPSPEE